MFRMKKNVDRLDIKNFWKRKKTGLRYFQNQVLKSFFEQQNLFFKYLSGIKIDQRVIRQNGFQILNFWSQNTFHVGGQSNRRSC